MRNATPALRTTMRIEAVISAYLNHLKALNRSPATLKNTRYALGHFSRFLEKETVAEIEALSFDVLAEYQEDLAFYVTAKGRLMEIESQAKMLSAVKGFTRFLRDEDYLVTDPGERIRLPKIPKRLPRLILSPNEVKALMAAQDMQGNIGYRDRILLEILYDTAIRRFEAAHIRIADLDLDAGYIRIKGKGDRERVVPASERVCSLIRNYILHARPAFVVEPDQGFLFIGRFGGKMHASTIGDIVKACVARSRIPKRISTHTFRHTCASHMLRNGAPLRHLQEMLGHANIETTQVYTRVTINDLKAIHAKYHPGEKTNPEE